MKKILLPVTLSLFVLLVACTKEKTADVPATSAASASAAVMAPMPGAKPFKQGAPEVPDPIMLQKKIDEARAQSGKDTKPVAH